MNLENDGFKGYVCQIDDNFINYLPHESKLGQSHILLGYYADVRFGRLQTNTNMPFANCFQGFPRPRIFKYIFYYITYMQYKLFHTLILRPDPRDTTIVYGAL